VSASDGNAEPVGPRFTLRSQSVQCPDGFARSLWYVWDEQWRELVLAHPTRLVVEQACRAMNGERARVWYVAICHDCDTLHVPVRVPFTDPVTRAAWVVGHREVHEHVSDLVEVQVL
jgi:hypothetical protein